MCFRVSCYVQCLVLRSGNGMIKSRVKPELKPSLDVGIYRIGSYIISSRATRLYRLVHLLGLGATDVV